MKKTPKTAFELQGNTKRPNNPIFPIAPGWDIIFEAKCENYWRGICGLRKIKNIEIGTYTLNSYHNQ